PPRGAGGGRRPAQDRQGRLRPLDGPARPHAGRAPPPGLHPRADAPVVTTSGGTGTSLLLLGGRPVPLAGPALRIDEATPLALALGAGVTGRLSLAGLPVPLVDGRADPPGSTNPAGSSGSVNSTWSW